MANHEVSPSVRVLYLDLLRIAATAAVVLVHVSAPVVIRYGQVPLMHWWLGNGLDALARWCVPVFVMISGAVLLDSAGTTYPESRSQFFEKRAIRIGIPLLFWTVFYAVFYHLFRSDPLSLEFTLQRIIFDQPYEHLYFLWLLLELALLTPWLRKVVRDCSVSSLGVLSVLFLIVTFFWVPRRLLFPFFVPYLGYYLAGVWLKKVKLQPWMKRMAVVTALVTWVVIAGGTWLSFAGRLSFGHPLILYEYQGLPVIAMSLGVFVIGKVVVNTPRLVRFLEKHSSILKTVSALTFGVYLIHPAVIELLRLGAGIEPTTLGLPGIAIVYFFTICLSASLSYGLELLARMGRSFFGS